MAISTPATARLIGGKLNVIESTAQLREQLLATGGLYSQLYETRFRERV